MLAVVVEPKILSRRIVSVQIIYQEGPFDSAVVYHL